MNYAAVLPLVPSLEAGKNAVLLRQQFESEMDTLQLTAGDVEVAGGGGAGGEDNGRELLARSRYLLLTSSDKWTENQKKRARLLFELYPDMKEAYSITHSLRMIFSNPRATKETGRQSFASWYGKVAEFDDANFNTVSATIYEREDEILNYFINRATNASAESLNSKIKKFRAQLHGVVDVKFFLFRLTNIYG